MISRYLVIVLAAGAAAMRVSQRAWIEALGLTALTVGLLVLQIAETRPALKPLAWGAFAVTAGTMVLVFVRMRAG